MTTPLFPVPKGWSWTTLAEISEVVGGVTKDSKRQVDEALPEVPYLRVANVQRGHLDLRDITRIRVPCKTLEKLRLKPGDVLLNEGGDRDKLGRGWVWEGQIEDCIHQNHVFRARLLPGVLHPKVLSWYANEVARGWFEEHASQSVNLASISLSRIRQLPVPIPPIEVQAEIVSSLDNKLSHLDAAERSVCADVRRLKALRKRIIIDAVPIPPPRDWELVSVADAGTVDLGRQRHPDWHSGPNMRPYLRVANVFEDRIDTQDLMEMDFSPYVFERFRLSKGDILLNEGQSPEFLGRPAMYKGDPPEVAFTNSLIRFRARSDVMPEWALLVFRRHMHAARFVREVRISTNIAHLSAGRFKTVEFPIPPMAEQERIISEAGERLTRIEWIRQTLEGILARMGSLRRTLIVEAVTGRSVRQDTGEGPLALPSERNSEQPAHTLPATHVWTAVTGITGKA